MFLSKRYLGINQVIELLWPAIKLCFFVLCFSLLTACGGEEGSENSAIPNELSNTSGSGGEGNPGGNEGTGNENESGGEVGNDTGGGSQFQPPVADVSRSQNLSGNAPLTVSFDASASTDADGNIISWEWFFGDGQISTAAVVDHVYTDPGSYLATLVITDDQGLGSTTQIAIVVSENLPVDGDENNLPWRPFADSSPWNLPVQDDAPVRADSEELLEHMRSTTEKSTVGRNFYLNTEQWTIPVFEVNDTTPLSSVGIVRYDGSFGGGINGASTGSVLDPFMAPIPDGAQPDPMSDAHMLLVDREQGISWDFFHAVADGNANWTCNVCTTTDLNGSGVRPNINHAAPWFRATGARACGFPLIAGLIRPEEIAAGSIDHALVIAYPGIRSNVFTSPASTAQAPGGNRSIDHCTGIPCGGRIRLKAEIDVDSLSLSEEAKIIARALQEYGAYVGDYAQGSVAIYAENNPQAWSGVLQGNSLFGLTPSQFEVLEWGTEFIDQPIGESAVQCGAQGNPQPASQIEIIDCADSRFATVFNPNSADFTMTQEGTANTASAFCGSVQVDGAPTYFIADRPNNFNTDRNEPYPLAIGWHGCGSPAGSMRGLSRMTQRNQVSGGILSVYPQSNTGNRCWNMQTGEHIFAALSAAFALDFNTDPTRVISTGYSSGAFMSNYLACTRPDELLGVIGLSGGLQSLPANCVTSGVAGYIAHNSDDPTSGINDVAFENVIELYAQANQCLATEIPVDTAFTTDSNRSCFRRDCVTDSLMYCRATSGGHSPNNWVLLYQYAIDELLSNGN